MTTLTARDIPYEIRIRLDQNGVRGAQYQTLRQLIREDGSVEQERENDVVPLALVDDGVRALLDTVLGESMTVALNENHQLQGQLAVANALIEELQAKLEAVPEPVPLTPAERITARRYQAQISGVQFNGMTVDTSADSQALLNGATLSAIIDPNYICRWKLSDGTRVELTAPQIIAVASAVRDHVQHCFDREDELLTALADGTFTEDMLEQGWPS